MSTIAVDDPADTSIQDGGGPPEDAPRAASRPSKPSRRRRPRSWAEWAILGACVLLLAWFALPLYVVVATALKGSAAGTTSFLSPPTSIDLEGFRVAWDSLHGNLWNSLQIAVPGTIISCLIGALNGFVLAKSPFRGSNLLFTLMLLGMFIPFQSIIIPLFQFLIALNLTGTLPGVTLVHIIYGIPITTLIFRNYYESIPTAVVEAAELDGCGLFGTFFRIILPLSWPGFVVAGIFQFTNIWNDFLFGLVVTNQQTWPVTVKLNNLIGTTTVDYGSLMAGAMLVAAPTLLVYVVLGKFFISGLTAGSVK
ncbi:carbohydrate ABC transporter permease [Nocardioides zeicaulis]|uniref:Carbohydrate ABC transporter permease n=1 Tax=Nocardioides zeicaulis TaxID=1776857 RepID=A0ABV6DWP6_9ACTN